MLEMTSIHITQEQTRQTACGALAYLIQMRPSSMTLEGKIVSGFGGREVHIGKCHRMFRRFEIVIIERNAEHMSTSQMDTIEEIAMEVCKANSNSVNIKHEHSRTA